MGNRQYCCMRDPSQSLTRITSASAALSPRTAWIWAVKVLTCSWRRLQKQKLLFWSVPSMPLHWAVAAQAATPAHMRLATETFQGYSTRALCLPSEDLCSGTSHSGETTKLVRQRALCGKRPLLHGAAQDGQATSSDRR